MTNLPFKFSVKTELGSIVNFTEIEDGLYFAESKHTDGTEDDGDIDASVIKYLIATGFYTMIEKEKEDLKSFKFHNTTFPNAIETAVYHEDAKQFSVRFSDRGNGASGTVWYPAERVQEFLAQGLWVRVSDDVPENNPCAEYLEELENAFDAFTLREIQRFTNRYDFTVTCIGDEFVVTSGDRKTEYHVTDANRLLSVMEAIAILEDAIG